MFTPRLAVILNILAAPRVAIWRTISKHEQRVWPESRRETTPLEDNALWLRGATGLIGRREA